MRMKRLPIDSSWAGVYPKRLMELNSVSLAVALAASSPSFPSNSDIVCRDKSDQQVFVVRLSPANGGPVSAMKTGSATIEGQFPFDLGKAFPRLHVEMNDTLIVIDQPPKELAIDEKPFDIEINIDRTNGVGRISAVENKAQAPACAACQEATEVDCTDRPR